LRPQQLALYGLQAADVLQTVNAAYHGTQVAQLDQADRSIPVTVRIAPSNNSPVAAGALLLRGSAGAIVPLSAVAALQIASGRSLIDHEDGLRRQVVEVNPHTSDQRGFAEAARRAIAAQVKLPAGVYLRYGGAAEAQASAARELLIHAGAALMLIVLLLALA